MAHDAVAELGAYSGYIVFGCGVIVAIVGWAIRRREHWCDEVDEELERLSRENIEVKRKFQRISDICGLDLTLDD